VTCAKKVNSQKNPNLFILGILNAVPIIMSFAAERRVGWGETLSAPKVDSILKVRWTTIKIYLGIADILGRRPQKTISTSMIIEYLGVRYTIYYLYPTYCILQ